MLWREHMRNLNSIRSDEARAGFITPCTVAFCYFNLQAL